MHIEHLSCTDAIIYHAQRKPTTFIHAYIHLTCSSIPLIEIKNCRGKIHKITYLMMNSIRNQLRRCNVPPNHIPACSLISQQRYHPRAGHDSPRNKGTSRLTHSQGYTKHSQANKVGFIRPLRSWRRQIAKLVISLLSQQHLHQNYPDL